MDNQFVRDRISELILVNHTNEVELSLAVGHSDHYINGITSGRRKPSTELIFAICDVFNITPSQFFDPTYVIDETTAKIIEFSIRADEDRRKMILKFIDVIDNSNIL